VTREGGAVGFELGYFDLHDLTLKPGRMPKSEKGFDNQDRFGPG